MKLLVFLGSMLLCCASLAWGDNLCKNATVQGFKVGGNNVVTTGYDFPSMVKVSCGAGSTESGHIGVIFGYCFSGTDDTTVGYITKAKEQEMVVILRDAVHNSGLVSFNYVSSLVVPSTYVCHGWDAIHQLGQAGPAWDAGGW